ncbi:MAG: peptide deformylase [Rhodanobacteraceae bacterium]|nr:peptide deformylase [Rhodanobacteraceae bacterium]
MALLPILEFPDPRLRTVAKPVETFDADLQKRIDDMFETMYAAPGVGLAATQIDWHRQLIVIDVSEEKDRPLVLINPRIVESEGSQSCQEGCLSVPTVFADVTRAERVVVEFLDRHAQTQRVDASGLLAICIQHEMDHLAGKVFVDYLSPLKKQMVQRKLDKRRRQQSAA